jgi:hypothetical protein
MPWRRSPTKWSPALGRSRWCVLVTVLSYSSPLKSGSAWMSWSRRNQPLGGDVTQPNDELLLARRRTKARASRVWTRTSSGGASRTCSAALAPRDRCGERWHLDVCPRAQRQLSRLPEKIATAAAESIVGSLLDNPYRVGHPLHDEYAGQHSARRGSGVGVSATGSTSRPRPPSCSMCHIVWTPMAPDAAWVLSCALAHKPACLIIPSPSAHPAGSGPGPTRPGGAPYRTNDLDA